MADTQIRRALAALESSDLGKRLASALITYGEFSEHEELLSSVAELRLGSVSRHRLGLSLCDVRRLVDDFGVSTINEQGCLRLTSLGRDVVEIDDAQHDGAEVLWAGAGVHSA